MDRELLDALSNLSLALEKISESLSKEKSESKTDVGSALQSGDFGKQLIEISEGIKSLKDDTKKILDNQETILKLQKEQSGGKESQLFEGAGKENNKKMLKDGISVVILIAGAVLAIGLAFKLIGTVDLVSVLAISVALPMIAFAFEKMSQIKDLTPSRVASIGLALVGMAITMTVTSLIFSFIKPMSFQQGMTIIFIGLVFSALSYSLENIFVSTFLYKKFQVSPISLMTMMVSLAAAITASSFIFGLITPVSFSQGLTAIMISATFALISFNLHKIALGVLAFEKTGVKASSLVETLLGISLAITLSSFILKLITPMSFSQLITAIFISAMFAIVSFNLEKIAIGVIAFKKTKVNPESLIETLVGISLAITLSSYVLGLVVPISFSQALTVILIALTFALISYVFPEMAIGLFIMKKYVSEKDFYLIPKLYLAISTAITLSSWILSLAVAIPFMTMLKIGLMAVVLSVITLAVGATAIILTKMGKPKDYFDGSLSVLIIATTIMLASIILSMGDYEEDSYPKVGWALGVGLSLVGFGLAALFLGNIGTDKEYFKGGLSVLIIAGTIMLVSRILSLGDYQDESYPGLGWSLGVSLSLVAFGIGALLLGTQALNPFFYAGLGLIILVSGTILATSLILNEGSYDSYPSVGWSLGVALSLSGFGIGALLLGTQALNPFFYAGLGLMLTVALTIVLISKVFEEGTYEVYPPSSWVIPTSLVIGSFAIMASLLALSLPLLVPGIVAIGLIVGAIYLIDRVFSTGKFNTFPNKAWQTGVNDTLESFSVIISNIRKKISFADLALGGLKMLGLAKVIKSIDDSFSEGKYEIYPNKEWVDGSFYALKTMGDLVSEQSFFGAIAEAIGDLFGVGGKSTVIKLAEGIVSIDKVFATGTFQNYPTREYIDGTIYAIQKFKDIVSMLESDDTLSKGVGSNESLKTSLSNIMLLAVAFDRLGTSMGNFSKSLQTLDLERLQMVKGLTSNVILLSLMDPDMFESMMDKLEERGGVFADLIKDFEEKKSSSPSLSPSAAGSVTTGAPKSNDLGVKLDRMTAILADISGVVGTGGDLRRYLLENTSKESNISPSGKIGSR